MHTIGSRALISIILTILMMAILYAEDFSDSRPQGTWSSYDAAEIGIIGVITTFFIVQGGHRLIKYLIREDILPDRDERIALREERHRQRRSGRFVANPYATGESAGVHTGEIELIRSRTNLQGEIISETNRQIVYRDITNRAVISQFKPSPLLTTYAKPLVCPDPSYYAIGRAYLRCADFERAKPFLLYSVRRNEPDREKALFILTHRREFNMSRQAAIRSAETQGDPFADVEAANRRIPRERERFIRDLPTEETIELDD